MGGLEEKKEEGKERERMWGMQLPFRRILSFCVDSEQEEALKFLPS